MCLIIRYYGLNAPCQQFVLVFVSYSYDLWHKTVLCFPSDNGWGSLTYVQWSKSLNKKNANNRKTASCHNNLDLKQILVKFNSPRQLGYQVDKPQ